MIRVFGYLWLGEASRTQIVKLQHLQLATHLIVLLYLISQCGISFKGAFNWFLLLVLLQCHVSVIPIYACLEERNLRNFSVCVVTAVGVCVLTYSLAGVFGYLTFGGSVESDVLESYSGSSMLVLAGITSVAVKTFTTYPILLFCGRWAAWCRTTSSCRIKLQVCLVLLQVFCIIVAWLLTLAVTMWRRIGWPNWKVWCRIYRSHSGLHAMIRLLGQKCPFNDIKHDCTCDIQRRVT